MVVLHQLYNQDFEQQTSAKKLLLKPRVPPPIGKWKTKWNKDILKLNDKDTKRRYDKSIGLKGNRREVIVGHEKEVDWIQTRDLSKYSSVITCILHGNKAEYVKCNGGS
jgi:hypothetical protein